MIVQRADTWRDLHQPTNRDRLDCWPLGTYRERRAAEREHEQTERKEKDHEPKQ